jgi:hypothetical protein
LAAESNEEPGGFGPGVGGVGFGGNMWLNRERIREDSDIVLVAVNSGHRLLRGTKILELQTVSDRRKTFTAISLG